MTLENVKLFRDTYFKGCDNISVMINENYNFDSREAFLVWDDDKELLKVIGPNSELAMVNAPNRRLEVFCIPYDQIVWIKSVPNSDDIATLLTNMNVTGKMAEYITTKAKQLSNIDTFCGGEY